MEKIAVTIAGFDRLEAELKHMKTVERPRIIEAISEARAHGDLSENAEYSAAKEKQSFIEGRIQELEAVISRADKIDVANIKSDKIVFGATVTIVDEESEEESTYQIVGDYEADLAAKRISMSAPVARALIGKKVGDSVEVKTPKGERYYEVLKIVYK
jgi:transcription elongation factor GreA